MVVIRGGCFCGFVRYELSGALSHETCCHCSICRRTSGAPFVAWCTVPATGFAFTWGEPASFPSSDHGTRTFCPRCGTPLTFRSTRTPEEVDVTIASLEDPEAVPPRDHTRTSSRLTWVSGLEALPSHDEERP